MRRRNANKLVLLKFKTREDWLHQRRIGGSDVAAIFGENPWETSAEVFLRLMRRGGEGDEKEKKSEAMERGIILEPLIRKAFAEDYRGVYKVTSPPRGNWLFYREDKPWLSGSLDGCLTRLSDKAKGVLEIKTVDVKNAQERAFWEGDELPQQYYYQVQTYALVTGAKFAVLRARIRYLRYDGEKYSVEKVVVRDYFIDEDEKKEELEYLDKKVEEFWRTAVEEEKFPAVKIY